MLQRHKTRINDLGVGRYEIIELDEVEDDPCTICGSESVHNWCRADGGNHHHGRVHNPVKGQNRLEARCELHAGTPNHSPLL